MKDEEKPGKPYAGEDEPVEGEVVTDVSEGGEPGGLRTIHVYGGLGEDDFRLEVPTESCITFGYFNPAAAERNRYGGLEGPGGQTMKTTALRIYAGKTSKTPQLACFLGVKGFRDTAIKIQRLKKKIVVERQYADDGEGEEIWSGKRQQRLLPKNEDEPYAQLLDEDDPF
jgi:hypothetical protein